MRHNLFCKTSIVVLGILVLGILVIGVLLGRSLRIDNAHLQTQKFAITRSATVVVAASDASPQSKAQADYIVVGSADDEIQAAFNALPTNGGKVQLSEGTFSFSSNVTWPAGKSIWIEGMGGAALGQFTGDIATTWVTTWAATVVTRSSDTVIFNLYADNYTSGGISNMQIDGAYYNSPAIALTRGVRDFYIQNDTITREGKAIAIIPAGGLMWDANSYLVQQIWITNNNMQRNTDGIYYSSAPNNEAWALHIDGNNVQWNDGYGMYFSSVNSRGMESFISSNYVHFNGKHGIQIDGMLDIILSNNYVRDNGTIGGIIYDQINISGSSNRINIIGGLIQNETTTGTRYGVYVTGIAANIHVRDVIIGTVVTQRWLAPIYNNSEGTGNDFLDSSILP